MRHRLLLDYDIYGHPELRDMAELLELVLLDARRIMHLLGPRAGPAVVKQSVNGYHLRFPFSRVTEEEVAWIMEGSPVDTGYRHWARERHSSTLRVAPKTIVKEVGSGEAARLVGSRRVPDTPRVVEVLENPWSKNPVRGG